MSAPCVMCVDPISHQQRRHGEVYRARDTKLERDVAIKVLREEFAKDKERLARFEREARLLASVNHPYIATLHGLEDVDGIRFLVMELVEAETLAERIARGSFPIGEALPLFLRRRSQQNAARAARCDAAEQLPQAVARR